MELGLGVAELDGAVLRPSDPVATGCESGPGPAARPGEDRILQHGRRVGLRDRLPHRSDAGADHEFGDIDEPAMGHHRHTLDLDDLAVGPTHRRREIGDRVGVGVGMDGDPPPVAVDRVEWLLHAPRWAQRSPESELSAEKLLAVSRAVSPPVNGGCTVVRMNCRWTEPTNHTPRYPGDGMGQRLDHEWQGLRRCRRALLVARGWAATGGALGAVVDDIEDLAVVVEATRTSGARDGIADAVLAQLIERSGHDELAGRVVIQRILPGLITRAVRYRTRGRSPDPVDEAIAAAWIALRRYDVVGRPRHIASALIGDAIFQAFRRPLRRRSATETSRPPVVFLPMAAPSGPATSADELSWVLTDAERAGVSGDEVALLRELARGESPSRVAAGLGVTPRTVRNRRDAAIRNVRVAVGVAA